MKDNIKIQKNEKGYFAVIDEKPITDPMPKSQIHAAIDAYVDADTNQNGITSKAEIKQELDEQGVEHKSSDSKSKLAKILTRKK